MRCSVKINQTITMYGIISYQVSDLGVIQKVSTQMFMIFYPPPPCTQVL